MTSRRNCKIVIIPFTFVLARHVVNTSARIWTHPARTWTNQFSGLRVSALLWCCVIHYQPPGEWTFCHYT